MYHLFPMRKVSLHQRNNNRQWKTDDKAQDAQQEGVFHQRPELGIGEEADEVLRPHPNRGVRKNLVTRHEVLKCDQHTVDR